MEERESSAGHRGVDEGGRCGLQLLMGLQGDRRQDCRSALKGGAGLLSTWSYWGVIGGLEVMLDFDPPGAPSYYLALGS